MIAAFAYLIYTSSRNRLASQLARIRNPRYAIALLLGLGYFWLVFFNPAARSSRNAVSPMGSETLAALVPVLVMLYVGYMWIFGADKSALAFTQAEVSMLFPAPVTRRGLIAYKLARAQSAILATSIIWLVVFRGTGMHADRAVGYWLFLSILSLHRLGVALIRSSQGEHGARGIRRNWFPAMVFAAVAGVVIHELFGLREQIMDAEDTAALARMVTTAFATPPLSNVLYPFRVAVGPMFAQAGAMWSHVSPALGLLVLHVWWVLRTETAFEEAAAEASLAQAKRLEGLRTRGISGAVLPPGAARRTIGLRSTGAPAVAIVWKNVLWLMRAGQLRTFIGLPAIACVAALVFAGRSEQAEFVIMAFSGAMAVMSLALAPLAIRNDLRGELRRLPQLKTMPLRGSQIMLAEVASSALPAAAMQFLLLVAALISAGFMAENSVPLPIRAGVLIGAPALLAGLNLANFTIHNGIALLFPAWVRLGETGVAGIEVMGQTMLTLLVTSIALLVLCIGPAAGAAAVWYVARDYLPVAIGAGAMVAGLVLTFEAFLVVGALGGSLDRLEPSQVG